MAVIASRYHTDLERLAHAFGRAARTMRAGTLKERDDVRRTLVTALRHDLELKALVDEQGLEALRAWTAALESADVDDVDHLQELLYGIDALVRVHIWRETGLPLTPPGPRSASDI